jgi:hypothetical protein
LGGEEPLDIGAVGSLGMGRAVVEPDGEELGIGRGLGRLGKVFQRAENGDFGAHCVQNITNGG